MRSSFPRTASLGSRYQARYRETPGSNDHNDPVWLLENISNDEIERTLSTLVPLATPATTNFTGRDRLFSDWEIQFIESVNRSYEEKHARGFHDRPLTGKQLFWLWKLYERVASDTEATFLMEAPKHGT